MKRRKFLKNATLSTVALTSTAKVLACAEGSQKTTISPTKPK